MEILIIYLVIGSGFVLAANTTNEERKSFKRFGYDGFIVPPAGIIFIGLTWPLALLVWVIERRVR